MSPPLSAFLDRRPTPDEARALARIEAGDRLERLIEAAGELRDRGHGDLVSYSRKVFLPLTHLCRDICHYCVFAQPPKKGEAAYMPLDAVLSQARLAAAAGCKEALFTLGDKPELRYKAAREGLAELGHESTLSYLREAAERVLVETGLLPHLNPGLMTAEDIEHLRPVAPSMGIMLESVSMRLHEKGQAHYGCPDKVPRRRLETLRLAGEAWVPFTSGILIGIGETREERIDALLALRDLHDEYGHIQEVIVQNFRAKPETRMADAPEPTLEDLLWTIAAARLVSLAAPGTPGGRDGRRRQDADRAADRLSRVGARRRNLARQRSRPEPGDAPPGRRAHRGAPADRRHRAAAHRRLVAG